MKLRVRINRQTSQVELPGQDPSLKELKDHIKETVLTFRGLRLDITLDSGSSPFFDCMLGFHCCLLFEGLMFDLNVLW